MKAIIITIGDEILMGQILDTNSQYIARSLTDMGVEITEILSIPDKRDEIYETGQTVVTEHCAAQNWYYYVAFSLFCQVFFCICTETY